MNIGEAKQLTGGGLGHPSKMPGTSYGISAHACITGAKLARVPGSVCHNCYALRNNYNYPSVAAAHANRMASLRDPQWPFAMALLIERANVPEHRWFDAGDLQGIWHLANIVKVCKLTPHKKHWLPTKELGFVLKYVRDGGDIPDNLLIRVSGTMIDGPATHAWPWTSTVHTVKPPKGAHVCPAPKQGNKCGKCRACWLKGVKHVSYHQH